MNIFNRIDNLIKTLIHINRIKADMESRIDSLDKEVSILKETIRDLGEDAAKVICSNVSALSILKNELSGVPTVWGDETRLHISDRAAVCTALFNTNSGEIFIGDYSFAGSNVSILTGSHDMTLTGLLRRDCEIKEGNDIHIGKGVWIASNAVILGPCWIGDNAVIAAGAVVVPGTNVDENEVYGGIPAKRISRIDTTPMSSENESVKRALEREDGIVFSDGWSDRMTMDNNGETFVGYMILEDPAVIYTNKDITELYYEVKDGELQTDIDVNGKEYAIDQKRGMLSINSSGTIEIKRKDNNMKIIIWK